jgi:hypothetical protein
MEKLSIEVVKDALKSVKGSTIKLESGNLVAYPKNSWQPVLVARHINTKDLELIGRVIAGSHTGYQQQSCHQPCADNVVPTHVILDKGDGWKTVLTVFQ